MKIKKNNGITLVALIITIIVMLILAGVSISLVVGENGVISQAEKAKEKQFEAEKKENIELAVSTSKIVGLGKIDENELEKQLKISFGDGGYTLSEIDENYVITVGEIEYKVNKEGRTVELETITFKFNYEWGKSAIFTCEKGMTWNEFLSSDYYLEFDYPCGAEYVPDFSRYYTESEDEPEFAKPASEGKTAYLCDQDNDFKYVHGEHIIIENHEYRLVQDNGSFEIEIPTT